MRNNSEPLPADCDGAWHLRLLGQTSSADNQRLGRTKNNNQQKYTRKYTRPYAHTPKHSMDESGRRRAIAHHGNDIITTAVGLTSNSSAKAP